MRGLRILTYVLLIWLLTGCELGGGKDDAFTNPTAIPPLAWVDAPINGLSISMSSYEFIAHASANTSVNQLEWVLNDASLGGTSANGQGKLATFRYHWMPQKAGVYTLKVRAQDETGVWSEFNQVTFRVDAPTPTPTLIPTITPTQEITFTPTPTETLTITPTPPAGPMTFSPGYSTNQFYYGACTPNSAEIFVQLSTLENVKHVELYLHLLDQESSQSTEWDSYSVMTSQGGGTFKTLVKSSQIPGANQFNKATVLYQFVVIGKDGKVLTRSDTYSDISLNKCGILFIQPLRTLIPVFPIKTPIVIK